MTKTKTKNKRLFTTQTGYVDGKNRRKSLKMRPGSPFWYIHYVDQNLTRQKLSTGLTELNEAIVALHSFSPFAESVGLRKKFRNSLKITDSEQEFKESQNSTSLSGAVELTLKALRSGALAGKKVRDYRESTLNNFKYAFYRFIRYCHDQGKYTSVASFKRTREFEVFFDGFLMEVEASGNGRNITTLRNYRRDLGTFADLMIKAGYLDENPFRYSSDVLKTTQEEKRTRSNLYTTLSPDEFARVLREFDVRINNMKLNPGRKFHNSIYLLIDARDISVLCFFTAMRLGEAAHTMWRDIDWENETISVSAKPDWSPKTQESIRTIPVSSPVFWEVLKRRYNAYRRSFEREIVGTNIYGEKTRVVVPLTGITSEYVFTHSCSKDYISHKFKEIIRHCFGADDPRHFHSLRHSAISFWVNENRMEITDAMDLAGHKNIQVTLGYRRRQAVTKQSKFDIKLDYLVP